MEIKIFYSWYNEVEDEGGHGISPEDKFESLKALSPRNIQFNVLFTFSTKDDFVSKFIENHLGNQRDAEIFVKYYKHIFG